MVNYYKVLGVDPKATEAEIKASYHRMARVFHPDVHKSRMNHERFILINQAYSVLRNKDSRRAYDWTLREEKEANITDNQPRVIYNAPTQEPINSTNVNTNVNNNVRSNSYYNPNPAPDPKPDLYSTNTAYLYNENLFNEYYKSAQRAFVDKSYVKAMKKVDMSIEVHPRSNRAHELKGDIYMVYTNYHEAKKEYEMALEYTKGKKNEKLSQKIAICEEALKPKKRTIFTRIKNKLFEEKE